LSVVLKRVALQATFPEHSGYKLKQHTSWKDLATQKQFLVDLGKKLNIQQKEDWYRISTSQVSKNGGSGLMLIYGSLSKGKVL
jgi:hypothetical protein